MKWSMVFALSFSLYATLLADDKLQSASTKARKGKFDATTKVECAQELSQAFTTCTAKIARGPANDIAVVVTFSNGFSRTLYFSKGEFKSANATMSGVGNDTDAVREKDLYLIRVDDQRYRISTRIIETE